MCTHTPRAISNSSEPDDELDTVGDSPAVAGGLAARKPARRVLLDPLPACSSNSRDEQEAGSSRGVINSELTIVDSDAKETRSAPVPDDRSEPFEPTS